MDDESTGVDGEEETFPINDSQTQGDDDNDVNEQQTYPLSVPGTPGSVVSQRSQQSTQSFGSVNHRTGSQASRTGSVMNTPSSVASSRRGGKYSQQTPTIMGTPRTPTRSQGGQLPSYSRSPFHSQQPFLPRSEFGHNHRTSNQRYQSTPNSNAPSSPGDSSPGIHIT